jgi:hypothetical protein
MDLKTLAKQYQEKLKGPKEAPPGHASVAMIAEALGVTPAKITRILAAGKVRRAGTVGKGADGTPGYSYYNLEQLAVAMGLLPEPRPAAEGGE